MLPLPGWVQCVCAHLRSAWFRLRLGFRYTFLHLEVGLQVGIVLQGLKGTSADAAAAIPGLGVLLAVSIAAARGPFSSSSGMPRALLLLANTCFRDCWRRSSRQYGA